jgi:indole-3-glycerol phosphate synthase
LILDEILATKRREVGERKRLRPLPLVEGPAPRDVRAALRRPKGVAIIAEIKRRSPSGGELRPGASSGDLARTYSQNGASMLSVLTDFTYFGGTDDDLVTAREASGLPVLRKDFLLDDYQVYEARALGADAVLLIVRALEPASLRSLLELTHRLGMHALVETHSADEVRVALDVGARILGVNNRDLDSLVTDPSLALRLRSLVPPEIVYVAESGIHHPEQMRDLANAGVDAVLIGESLVRAPDPGARLAEFVGVPARI